MEPGCEEQLSLLQGRGCLPSLVEKGSVHPAQALRGEDWDSVKSWPMENPDEEMENHPGIPPGPRPPRHQFWWSEQKDLAEPGLTGSNPSPTTRGEQAVQPVSTSVSPSGIQRQ